jgi:hypothetical protein
VLLLTATASLSQLACYSYSLLQLNVRHQLKVEGHVLSKACEAQVEQLCEALKLLKLQLQSVRVRKLSLHWRVTASLSDVL